MFSSVSFGILFKLWQRGIHFVPRCPHIHLLVEPARIIQVRGSDRCKLRGCVGIDHNRRAAVWAKAPMSHATRLTGRVMEAQRALQNLESLRRHDDESQVSSPLLLTLWAILKVVGRPSILKYFSCALDHNLY